MGKIADEFFLRDAQSRTCSGLLGTTRVQLVHRLRLEFPADNGLGWIVTADPRMNQSSGRIDLKKLAFSEEFLLSTNKN